MMRSFCFSILCLLTLLAPATACDLGGKFGSADASDAAHRVQQAENLIEHDSMAAARAALAGLTWRLRDNRAAQAAVLSCAFDWFRRGNNHGIDPGRTPDDPSVDKLANNNLIVVMPESPDDMLGSDSAAVMDAFDYLVAIRDYAWLERHTRKYEEEFSAYIGLSTYWLIRQAAERPAAYRMQAYCNLGDALWLIQFICPTACRSEWFAHHARWQRCREEARRCYATYVRLMTARGLASLIPHHVTGRLREAAENDRNAAVMQTGKYQLLGANVLMPLRAQGLFDVM